MSTSKLSERGVASLVFAIAFHVATALQAITINLTFHNTNQNQYVDPNGVNRTNDLQQVMQAAATYWERIIQDPYTFQVDYQWRDIQDTFVNGSWTDILGEDRFSWQTGSIRCDAGDITFDTNDRTGAARQWFLDTTPFADEEFGMAPQLYGHLSGADQAAWYGGSPPDVLETSYSGSANSTAPADARQGHDLLSVALHELGHMIGVPGSKNGLSDNAYDIPPSLVGGESVAVMADPNHVDHLAATDANMYWAIDTGVRRRLSATDVLAAAATASWSQIDLPRKNFVGDSEPSNSDSWTVPENWIGGAVPDADDQVYIRHRGRVTLPGRFIPFGSSAYKVAELYIGELSELDVNGSCLTSPFAAELNVGQSGQPASGLVTLDSAMIKLGGEIKGRSLIIKNGGELAVQGGLLEMDSMHLTNLLGGQEYANRLSGYGTLEIANTLRVSDLVQPVAGPGVYDESLFINAGGSVILDSSARIFANLGSLQIGDLSYDSYNSFGGQIYVANGHLIGIGGNFRTSSRNVQIIGSGSSLSVNGALSLESVRGFDATLEVKAGGHVESNLASIGGVLTVKDPGSSFQVGRIEPDGHLLGGQFFVASWPNQSGAVVVSNGAILQTQDSKGSFDFVGMGLFSGGEPVTGNVTVQGRGSQWLSDGIQLGLGRSAYGGLNIRNGGTVSTNGDAKVGVNSGKGVVSLAGAGSKWNISGSLHLGDGTDAVGRVTVGRGAEIRVAPGEIVQVSPHSELLGSGRITGDIVCNGRCAPGMSVGTLLVDGDYVQGGSGVLEIEVGGLGHVPGLDLDLLQVTGTAALGGFLDLVSLVPVPAGMKYDLSEFVDAESLTILNGFQLAADDRSQWRLVGTSVISIPEPSGIGLAWTCLLALVAGATRRVRAGAHIGRLEK